MIDASFWELKKIKAIALYCEKFEKDFSKVIRFYEEHEASANWLLSGRDWKLIDKLRLKEILGMDPEEIYRMHRLP